MRLALSYASQSPPRPTNFRVGAVLVDADSKTVLSTGYTLELPGNTHAEQCCLSKYAALHGVAEENVAAVLPAHTVLFSTMEPCAKRLSGNASCVTKILGIRRGTGGGEEKKGEEGGIGCVYYGVKEPDTFVGDSAGTTQLEREGIECVYVPGLEEHILRVATTGHDQAKAGVTV